MYGITMHAVQERKGSENSIDNQLPEVTPHEISDDITIGLRKEVYRYKHDENKDRQIQRDYFISDTPLQYMSNATPNFASTKIPEYSDA